MDGALRAYKIACPVAVIQLRQAALVVFLSRSHPNFEVSQFDSLFP